MKNTIEQNKNRLHRLHVERIETKIKIIDDEVLMLSQQLIRIREHRDRLKRQRAKLSGNGLES